jgi:hypothetical protein
MSRVVTVVDTTVPPDREQALVEGFAALVQPETLLRAELLRGPEGRWRVQSTWRSLDDVRALRAEGRPPAVLALLDGLGLPHEHGYFTVEGQHGS